MNSYTKRVANAISGKTARACDSCLRKRARWYCAADDAFLCQGCDSNVHSANQLASRHQRVRIEKASSGSLNNHAPSWHQGFTKKARTPRHGKPVNTPPKKEKEEMEAVAENITSFLPALVPEMGSEEGLLDENEEQLLYRVPMLDPFDAELCCVPNGMVDENNNKPSGEEQPGVEVEGFENFHEGCELDNFHGLLPTDMELAEFAADVETLLGTGLEDELCGIESLGLMDCKEEEEDCGLGDFFEERKVKVEEEGVGVLVDSQQLDLAMDMTRETIDWNFDYESPATDGVEEEEEEKVVCTAVEKVETNGDDCKLEVKKKILLRLDYEAVIAAWDCQGSPWTNGNRPDLNPDDGWPDFMGLCSTSTASRPYLEMGGQVKCSDGGREARVSRYREKRRTRLFSKKIRYEVRKLNAEKRPRMKGRFVKRTSFPGNSFPNYMMNK